jgi:hypothetical protein
MKLYQHQQQVVDENKPIFGNFRGTGSGKTRTTVAIAEGTTLVICPKTQMIDRTWDKEWIFQNKPGALFVISKEQFKKKFKENPLSVCGGIYPDTIIMDEVHTMCGVQPYTRQKNYVKYPKTSQIYDAIIKYIEIAKPKRVHPLTATPIPQPMAVYALSSMLGKNWDFFKFRDIFYIEKTVRGRQLYLPNRSKANKELMNKTVNSLGYTGTLEDFVDVPDQFEKVHKVEMTDVQKSKIFDLAMMFPDPLVLAGKLHQLEQGIFEDEFLAENKTAVIDEYMQQFGRVVLFVKYTNQINYYKKYFESKYPVKILNGKTKDKERKIMAEEAEQMEECLFIAQSSISAGWELPTFPCMIFASHSYSLVDFDQAPGRIQRIHNIKKNVYIHLVNNHQYKTNNPTRKLLPSFDSLCLATLRDKKEFSTDLYRDDIAKLVI